MDPVMAGTGSGGRIMAGIAGLRGSQHENRTSTRVEPRGRPARQAREQQQGHHEQPCDRLPDAMRRVCYHACRLVLSLVAKQSAYY
jgi:cysteine synthase